MFFRPWVAGIHGRATIGCYSIVLNGGYEDDLDNGSTFLYTGSGTPTCSRMFSMMHPSS
jgi:hypothetical protein